MEWHLHIQFPRVPPAGHPARQAVPVVCLGPPWGPEGGLMVPSGEIACTSSFPYSHLLNHLKSSIFADLFSVH